MDVPCGFSNSSHIHGGIVDTVQELDVVTGDGRLLTVITGPNMMTVLRYKGKKR